MTAVPAHVVADIEAWRQRLRDTAHGPDAYDAPYIAPASVYDEAVAAGIIVDGRYRAAGPRDAILDGTRWIRADQ